MLASTDPTLSRATPKHAGRLGKHVAVTDVGGAARPQQAERVPRWVHLLRAAEAVADASRVMLQVVVRTRADPSADGVRRSIRAARVGSPVRRRQAPRRRPGRRRGGPPGPPRLLPPAVRARPRRPRNPPRASVDDAVARRTAQCGGRLGLGPRLGPGRTGAADDRRVGSGLGRPRPGWARIWPAFETALALPWDRGSAVSVAARASVLNAAGYATMQTRGRGAIRHFEEAAALYEHLGDAINHARGLSNCGFAILGEDPVAALRLPPARAGDL